MLVCQKISHYAAFLGIETTVGTFTFPFVFVTTDLTVRLYGAHKARKVIFYAMLPALVISYFVGTLFAFGQFQGFAALGTFSIFVFRIAAASFGAYIFGQLADILVFQRLRKLPRWWPAPAASSIFGNLLDTFAFFSIAFYQCVDPYMGPDLNPCHNVSIPFERLFMRQILGA